MHDTVTGLAVGPRTSGQLSASRCNHCAFSPGPIDHGLTGIHPVRSAMWAKLVVCDSAKNGVNQQMITERLRPIRQASEALGVGSPEFLHAFVA